MAQAYLSSLTLSSFIVARKHPLLHRLISAHVVPTLLFTAIVYAYRNVWPLATYYSVPADAHLGWLTWTRVVILGYAGLMAPLVIPRLYVPVDPRVMLVFPSRFVFRSNSSTGSRHYFCPYHNP